MTVLLTGPDGDGGALGASLRAAGAGTLGVPLLVETGPPDPGPLHAAAARLGEFDLVVFTSARGVRAVTAVAGGACRGIPAAVVGPGTAAAAVEAGFEIAVKSVADGAAGLLEALDAVDISLETMRILLPLSVRAGTLLEEGLVERGAQPEVVAAYDVRIVEDPEAALGRAAAGGADAMLLASPSAVEALVAGGAASRTDLPPLVAIGATTASALELHGLVPWAVASTPDATGILAALDTVAGRRN